ncbi:hypothetical protein [Minwuia sp.]|uniref:hypothetical protein n=1 Tax=Minwuia sp. TaxID=2493630 RepID=UPI003A95B757
MNHNFLPDQVTHAIAGTGLQRYAARAMIIVPVLRETGNRLLPSPHIETYRLDLCWPKENPNCIMRRILLVMFALVFVLVAGGIAFVATTDIPPPSKQVRKVIPDDRFPK